MRAMAGMDLRKPLVEALAADLVGPYAVDERLRLPPSRWYLTGFLVPKTVRDSEERDPTDDEEMAAGNDETEEESQGNAEPEPKQKNCSRWSSAGRARRRRRRAHRRPRPRPRRRATRRGLAADPTRPSQ